MQAKIQAAALQRTRQAFLLKSLFNAPFWTLYEMLAFILYKDLHASAFQITILIALKPVVSIFSVYWSSFVHKRPDRLRSNVIAAGLIGLLPFFFAPLVNQSWYFIFSGALYMMLTRGVVPAWMEILKLNLPQETRERVFSSGSAISYLAGVLLPIFFGGWMDLETQVWRWLFPFAALLSLTGIIFQLRIPLPKQVIFPRPEQTSIKQILLKPWKDTLLIFKTRPDFVKFLIGFMLGGSGLMILQPALPIFFIDTLNISYAEIAIVLSLCKGIGFALTSRLWASWFNRLSIYRLSSLVTLIATLFPIGLIFTQKHSFLLYISYLLYGIMQAGSELSWHLSGPIFSKKEDSSVYSSVNVVTVGLRGCIAPTLGAFLCSTSGPVFVFVIAALLCFLASIQLHMANKRKLSYEVP